MLQLSQFNLQLALPGSGALGEYVKDQRGSIKDFAIKSRLQITGLGWRQFIIEDHGIHIFLVTIFGKFIGFARADKGSRKGGLQFLSAVSHHNPTSGRRQFS